MTPDILNQDEQFFAAHSGRQCHIREPRGEECSGEFLSLGFHMPSRRRIIIWKVPKGTPFKVGELMKIPFLKFADESIEDDDRVLLPLLHTIMMQAAKDAGMPIPKKFRDVLVIPK